MFLKYEDMKKDLAGSVKAIDPLHVTSRNNFNIWLAILEDNWSMKAMESKWKILLFELRLQQAILK